MSVKRLVDTGFWQNPSIIDNFSVEDKYFYLYLMTNSYNNICGVARVSFKTIAYELGYSIDVVKVLIARFKEKYNIIDYDDDTNEILVVNWYKYNWTLSPLLLKNITKTITEVKSEKFKNYLESLLVELEKGSTIDRVLIPYKYVTISNTNTNTIIEDRNYKGKKLAKRFVKPTIKELEEYCKEKGYNVDCEHFYNYYESNGWKVGSNSMKNWKAALTNWSKRSFGKTAPVRNSMPDWYEEYKTREVDSYDYNLDESLINDFLKGE